MTICDSCKNNSDHEISYLKKLAGISNSPTIVTQGDETSYGEQISKSGTEIAHLQRQLNIKPGDPKWFAIWFSKPLLTGVDPISDLKNGR
jgi:hypothetical protein